MGSYFTCHNFRNHYIVFSGLFSDRTVVIPTCMYRFYVLLFSFCELGRRANGRGQFYVYVYDYRQDIYICILH